MSILDISNLKFSYGDKQLFNSLEMRLFHNDHLGLIGANGTGKSTLLKLIAHKIDPDEGLISWQTGVSYSYLDQYLTVDSEITVNDYLYQVYDDLFKRDQEMQALYETLIEADPEKYDKILNSAYYIQNELEEKGFYLIKSRISNVTGGLGLDENEERALKDLSSGERIKVFLAKMLLEEKDVLLLDEPTNFLDARHIEWLSNFLSIYKKAFIIVSHDPHFLKICNVICELENKDLNVYKGNYEAYLTQKQMREDEYQKKYNSQQKFIKKTEDFIQKNIVRASTTKRAQSRRKVLEKLDVLEKPKQQKPVRFDFPFTGRFNSTVLSTRKLLIGYSNPLLPELDLKINFGEKIVILGKNGVGKTTFLKTVLGIIPQLSGEVKLSPLNNITYYAQEYLGRKDITPIQFIQEHYPRLEVEKIRTLLAKYGVVGDLALKTLDRLSGGELTKVRFSKLSLETSNLLILDEPTNHLDHQAKEALYKAIKNYSGTILLVTHEQAFYKKLNLKEIHFE
ncbi:MAG: ABC-F family ATP-binding cassette domain-containing protein [Bacilli bacterium]|nr:ABC-F family ATP-binding cassette domain-containing protein [Bacilli bacterium]